MASLQTYWCNIYIIITIELNQLNDYQFNDYCILYVTKRVQINAVKSPDFAYNNLL